MTVRRAALTRWGVVLAVTAVLAALPTLVRAWPARASPVIRLTSPGGSVSRMRSAIASADTGVWSAGLSTTALPARSAGSTPATNAYVGWL